MSATKDYLLTLCKYHGIEPVNEGLKIGKKERETVLRNSEKFRIGIEYEFHPNDDTWYREVADNGDVLEHVSDRWEVSFDVYNFVFNPKTRKVEENDYDIYNLRELNSLMVVTYYELELLNDPPETILSDITAIINELLSNLRSWDTFIDIVEDLHSLLTNKGRHFLIRLFESKQKGEKFHELITLMNQYESDSSNTIKTKIEELINEIENFGDLAVKPLNIILDDSFKYFNYKKINSFQNKNGLAHHMVIYGLDHQTTIEGHNQIELITRNPPMSLSDAIKDLKKVFSFIDSYGTTSKYSGLHISVSVPDKFNSGIELNYEKLFILMNFGFITKNLFGERDHVDSIDRLVKTRIKAFISTQRFKDIALKHNSAKMIYDKIFDEINFKQIVTNKYQSMNLGDYHKSNGRIELRFFGGENYEKRYNEIVDLIIKSLLLISSSYDDKYDRIYQKARYLYIDNIVQEIEVLSFPEIIKDIKRNNR